MTIGGLKTMLRELSDVSRIDMVLIPKLDGRLLHAFPDWEEYNSNTIYCRNESQNMRDGAR